MSQPDLEPKGNESTSCFDGSLTFSNKISKVPDVSDINGDGKNRTNILVNTAQPKAGPHFGLLIHLAKEVNQRSAEKQLFWN